MVKILSTILNYLFVIIKLFLFCMVLSLPIVGITYLLSSLFKKFNKKFSYIVSLFLCIIIVIFPILLLLYFLPILSNFSNFSFIDGVLFFLFQFSRLLLISLLFSCILVILGMFISLIYDSKKQKKIKKKKINFLNLWKSTVIVITIIFAFVLIFFPKLPVIVLYLIYM